MEMSLKILEASYQVVIHVSRMESTAVAPCRNPQKVPKASPARTASVTIATLEIWDIANLKALFIL